MTYTMFSEFMPRWLPEAQVLREVAYPLRWGHLRGNGYQSLWMRQRSVRRDFVQAKVSWSKFWFMRRGVGAKHCGPPVALIAAVAKQLQVRALGTSPTATKSRSVSMSPVPQ